MNIITAITAQRRNTSRCSVYLDGEFAFGCTIETAERFALRKGLQLAPALRSELESYDDRLRVRRAAYTFVSFKPRTRKQVHQKMREKGFSADEADEAVEFLEDLRLLNDQQYARMFITDALGSGSATALARKAVGLDKIRMELKKRGVSEHDIADTLAEHFDRAALAAQSADNAVVTARKKMALLRKKESDERKRRAALAAHLQRQGFSYDETKRAIAQVEAEFDEDNEHDEDDESDEE
jgi:regulatory protein